MHVRASDSKPRGPQRGQPEAAPAEEVTAHDFEKSVLTSDLSSKVSVVLTGCRFRVSHIVNVRARAELP